MSTQLANRTDPKPVLKLLLQQPEIQHRIKEVLGERASEFGASVVSLANSSQRLMEADPKSVIAACMTAALLRLPISRDLGFAHIVPYSGVAQFQMGYKGFIQLAMRTAQYRHLNACAVYEGELVRYDRLSGEVVIDETAKKSEKVAGYAAYFELTNGFKHSLYWTAEQVEAHAKRYSQAYKSQKKDSPWFNNFESMALKTVIKALLSKWGILSIEMQTAMREDQGVRRTVDVTDAPAYPDSPDTAGLFDRPEVAMPQALPENQPEKASQDAQGRDLMPPPATGTPEGDQTASAAKPRKRSGASGELPLGHGKPSEPADNSLAPLSEEGSDTTGIEAVAEISHGGEGKKRWTMWGIKDITGREFTTFDAKLAGAASGYQKSGEFVKIAWKKQHKGDKVYVNLIAIEDPAGAEPAEKKGN